jgi:hypothetical protein
LPPVSGGQCPTPPPGQHSHAERLSLHNGLVDERATTTGIVAAPALDEG